MHSVGYVIFTLHNNAIRGILKSRSAATTDTLRSMLRPIERFFGAILIQEKSGNKICTGNIVMIWRIQGKYS